MKFNWYENPIANQTSTTGVAERIKNGTFNPTLASMIKNGSPDVHQFDSVLDTLANACKAKFENESK